MQNGIQKAFTLGHDLVMTLAIDIDIKAGCTSLRWAAKNGHEELVPLMLDKGANTNAQDADGMNSLHLAASNGREPVVRLLLEREADIIAKTDAALVALWYASMNEREAVVDLLLQGGADLDAKDDFRRNALSYAAKCGYSTVVQLLLDSGADIDAKNYTRQTPLSLAANYCHETTVQLLLNGGAGVCAKNDIGMSALTLAAQHGHSPVVQLLLDSIQPISVRGVANHGQLQEDPKSAMDTVKELQLAVAASMQSNILNFRDADYFDVACGLGDLKDGRTTDRFDNAVLDGADVDACLADRVHRWDIIMSVTMAMIWEFIYTRYLFGLGRENRSWLKAMVRSFIEIGPRGTIQQWRVTTLALFTKRPEFTKQRRNDSVAIATEIFETLSRVLSPPSNVKAQLVDSLNGVLKLAVDLSIEMRMQLAEYLMFDPCNQTLFPLLVRNGDDFGEGDDEVVIFPAQVLSSFCVRHIVDYLKMIRTARLARS
ncbi:hypothetical protein BBP40_008823 [Aspergillus hancockii]|nr:hypothetical protein BBP40_008823 [Aspergillus hancockii]